MDSTGNCSEDMVMSALMAAARHRLRRVMVAETFFRARKAEEQAILSSPRPFTPMPRRLGRTARRRRQSAVPPRHQPQSTVQHSAVPESTGRSAPVDDMRGSFTRPTVAWVRAARSPGRSVAGQLSAPVMC